MSRLIKIIDESTIEIAEYRNPEATFKSAQNPPTLQNIKDEIEHLEWYCTFKATINPFQMYAENERLHSIIKEAREYIEHKASIRECYMINGKEYKELLKILDKE